MQDCGSKCSPTNSVPRESQIPGEISRLGGSVDKLTSTIGELEERLMSVLTPYVEEESANKAPNPDEFVEVASEIRSQRWRVEDNQRVIFRLLERLEV